MQMASILGLHRRDLDHLPHLTLTMRIAEQHAQQLAHVQPITLGATPTAIDLNGGGIHHVVGDPVPLQKPHSIEFSGEVGHCSSKASRREDLEIEQPVACWDCASFHFHPTLARMLGATLIRDQVVEVRYPGEKRLLAAT